MARPASVLTLWIQRRSDSRCPSKKRAALWRSSPRRRTSTITSWESSDAAKAPLFALLSATGHTGTTPPIHVLGLFEPLSQRYLDLITVQVDALLKAQVKSGAITTSLEKTVEDDLKNAITRLRATGTVKANLPYGLENLLNPSDALFLSQADKFDPALLASHVTRTPVLLS